MPNRLFAFVLSHTREGPAAFGCVLASPLLREEFYTPLTAGLALAFKRSLKAEASHINLIWLCTLKMRTYG